ncbi:MAG: hypothetical protein BroJett025_08870 [Patescibacteria group bacterium]|nr:MAG: hypothetical protein BroJett025_08870 [Patescibacteria group bacterium]
MKFRQIINYFFGCLVGTSILFINSQPIHAQTVFTDDFSQEYQKWQDVRNTFDLWSIVNQQSDVFINTGSTLAEIIPKDEYWNSSWKNYVYELDYTYLEGADKALSFWFKDIFNWYQFHFIGNNYILSHIKNGQEVWRQDGPLVLEVGKTYHMEVHLKEGNIQFFIEGVKQFEYDDPTFENDHGRIGLKAGAGAIFPTHVQFDNIVVSLISNAFILPVTPLKQTNPSWSSIEYDTATNWATENFGIGDWGCLLTSINMILKYHNISHFVDGTEITPKTLNEWLNNQADGFIGPGLVNWSAISRLVKQIHDATGLVNLEYSRIAGDNLETATTEIQNNKPIILEIPGHFFVGNGIPEAENDLTIVDPSYDFTLLSQHQTQLLSTRLLTPSFTDLSFIHASHADTISVLITDQGGAIPPNYETYPQFISNSNRTQQSPSFVLHELAKPTTGSYRLSITSNAQLPQPYTLKLFAYNITADVSDLTYTGVAGTTEKPTILTVSFDKHSSSSITTNSSFEHLLSDIQIFSSTSKIQKKYIAFELSQLTQSAIEASVGNKPRYIQALTKSLNWYSPYISSEAKTILFERLTEIQNNL